MRTWRLTSWRGRTVIGVPLVAGAIMAGSAAAFTFAQPVGAQGDRTTYIQSDEVTVEPKHGPGGGIGLKVSCKEGDLAVGGGFTMGSSYIKLIRAYPETKTTWGFAFAHHGTLLGLPETHPVNKPHQATGYVVCLNGGQS
jgi:hypothetical protein